MRHTCPSKFLKISRGACVYPMLKVKPISIAFQLKITKNFQKMSKAVENEVNLHWQHQLDKADGILHNGNIMSATRMTDGIIYGSIVEYRYLIGQRTNPKLFKVLKIKPLAVSGLLKCKEGIVFGRRSSGVTQDAGFWELVPSGGIDTSIISNIKNIDYCKQILIELNEEVGLESDLISTVKPFCLVKDISSHVIDIGILLISSLSFSDILTSYNKIIKKEYSELQVVPNNKLKDFLNIHKFELAPVSVALIASCLN